MGWSDLPPGGVGAGKNLHLVRVAGQGEGERVFGRRRLHVGEFGDGRVCRKCRPA
jgi:hypothetical protein